MPEVIVATGTIAQYLGRLCTVDGSAFAWPVGLDLTPYLGQRLELKDAANKVASGFLLAAGGANESLGAELAPNNNALSDSQVEADATTGYIVSGTPTSWASDGTAPHTGTRNFKVVTTGSGQGWIQSAGSSPGGSALGKLIKHVHWLRSDGARNIALFVYNHSTAVLLAQSANVISTIYAAVTVYTTGIDADTKARVVSQNSGVTTFYGDTYSANQVLSPGAGGALIASARGGTVRNWASVEAGFAPHNALTYTIYGQTNPTVLRRRRW